MLVPWTQYTSAYDISNKDLYAFSYDNHNLKVLHFGNPDEWSHVRYFDFVLKQTYEPFEEEL